MFRLTWLISSPPPVFELHTKQDCSVRVHFTSTGDKVYGPVPDGKGQSTIYLLACLLGSLRHINHEFIFNPLALFPYIAYCVLNYQQCLLVRDLHNYSKPWFIKRKDPVSWIKISPFCIFLQIWNHIKMPWGWSVIVGGGRSIPHTSRSMQNTSSFFTPLPPLSPLSLSLPLLLVSCSARNLARLLKDLCRHVPGLRLLDPWHIELLVCSLTFGSYRRHTSHGLIPSMHSDNSN